MSKVRTNNENDLISSLNFDFITKIQILKFLFLLEFISNQNEYCCQKKITMVASMIIASKIIIINI
jgi:hypothetical protein